MSVLVLSLVVVALVSVVGSAIVAAVAALPLEVLERGSAHGRYAGLAGADPPPPASPARGLPVDRVVGFAA